MSAPLGLLGLILVGFAPPPEPVADAVTLRDGSVVLGSVVEAQTNDPVLMIVRRAWAEAKQPRLAKVWEAEADRQAGPALAEQKSRLLDWKRERNIPPITPGHGIDVVANWIETELAKVAAHKPGDAWPLMMVRLGRNEVASVVRKSPELNRLCRSGWLAGFPDVETMEPDVIQQALEDRGFDARAEHPVDLGSILEPHPVPEARWFEQRAATELTLYHRPRILRYRNCVAFSMLKDERVSVSLIANARSVIDREMSGRPPVDTVATRLEHLARNSQFGVVEIQLELNHDLSAVKVESWILARTTQAQWAEVVHHSEIVKLSDLPKESQEPSVPPSKADLDLRVFDAIAFGLLPDDAQHHLPRLGQAARKALDQTHRALEREIAGRTLADRSR